ncbi:MAG: redoxin domain-containing protein [Deltaproteobacteria bacterium]|nr:MAG: redoxin domain-containing protein [Deltaproteobacteria bacterium]
MRSTRAILPLLVTALFACGEGDDRAAPVAAAAAAERPAARESKRSAPRRRDERPLPAFDGRTLDGEPLAISSLLGKRLLLFLFDPSAPESAPAAKAVRNVKGLRGEHNFEIVGIAMGSSRDRSRAFADANRFDFVVFDDSGGSIARTLGLRAPVALVGVDAEGYLTFARGGVPIDASDATSIIEAGIREALRLPVTRGAMEPVLGERPLAPNFKAVRLDGDETFELASLRGTPTVLVFFLHTCPHCHSALRAIRKTLAEIPENARPAVAGISLQDRPAEVRAQLARDGLDFFTVLFDSDQAIRAAYGGITGVPVIFLIDAEGRIASRVQGWRDDRDPPLMRMWLTKLAGQPIPMLLHPTGYSGNEFCVPCHEPQNDTWLLTRHAGAFNTLIKHGASRSDECVGCHVVGWEESGGYTFSPPTPHFEDVGCETCHGRGGPHLSPGFAAGGWYEPACVGCHDAKHSLGFDYASFVPKVSHAANLSLAQLSLEEKRSILAERRSARANLLPSAAEYVGSLACQSCHPAEYDTWSASAHQRSVASLEAKGEASNPTCLSCHTTGYGRAGGFPASGSAAEHPTLASVGCESCHGPGGDHIGEKDPRVGTILSLGDKCDSCVILQLCGTCHDDTNDPGFEFEVLEKIEAQRHGTIEASANRSDDQASLPAESPAARLRRLGSLLPEPGERG